MERFFVLGPEPELIVDNDFVFAEQAKCGQGIRDCTIGLVLVACLDAQLAARQEARSLG